MWLPSPNLPSVRRGPGLHWCLFIFPPRDILRAYDSAARDARGDVQEPIPEFFTCAEYVSDYLCTLGVALSQQTRFERYSKTVVKEHKKLPPWGERKEGETKRWATVIGPFYPNPQITPANPNRRFFRSTSARL
jgi:hypothetical protein